MKHLPYLLLSLCFTLNLGCSGDDTASDQTQNGKPFVQEDQGTSTGNNGTNTRDLGATTKVDMGSPSLDMNVVADMNTAQDQGGTSTSSDMATQTDMVTQEDMSPMADMNIAPDQGGMMVDMAVAMMDPATTLNVSTLTINKTSFNSSSGSIPVTVYRPASQGPHPVVAFHHGFNLGPELYDSYGKHLASWGFLVVMPKMPGSVIRPTSHSDLASIFLEMITWLGTNPVEVGSVDTNKIIVAGHSLGGKIAFLSASRNASIKGVFGIDAVDALPPTQPVANSRYPSVTPELMPNLRMPIVSLGERVNATCSGLFCQTCAPEDDNFQKYYQGATVAPALEIEVKGANHMDFLDNPNCGFTCNACSKGTIDDKLAKLVTRRALTAFALVTLQGKTSYKTWLAGAEAMKSAAAGEISLQQKNGF